MRLLGQIGRLFQDPPPRYIFEISEAGIAFAKHAPALETGFRPFQTPVLAVSPLQDNVLLPEALAAAALEIAPKNGVRKRRETALILPDYCGRISVLDFDSFPSEPEEQVSLVRFRVKRSVPFDVESAAISYSVQHVASKGKSVEVIAATVSLEIIARYEAPFRSAGLHPGFVTMSSLASLNLAPHDELVIVAKISGRVLTVSVVSGGGLKLLRCVELESLAPDDIMAVLFPTVAFIEDELGAKPRKMMMCGFGASGVEMGVRWETELGVPVAPLRSRFGAPDQTNAGLYGYLEAAE